MFKLISKIKRSENIQVSLLACVQLCYWFVTLARTCADAYLHPCSFSIGILAKRFTFYLQPQKVSHSEGILCEKGMRTPRGMPVSVSACFNKKVSH
jgi:hypothetical protein